jgi:hypothetical protein
MVVPVYCLTMRMAVRLTFSLLPRRLIGSAPELIGSWVLSEFWVPSGWSFRQTRFVFRIGWPCDWIA